MPSDSPMIRVTGEVRGIRPKTFTEQESGEVIDKGRTLTVLTDRGGFLSVTVPKAKADLVFETGERVDLDVEVFVWDMAGRQGTAFILTDVVSQTPALA